MLLRISSVSRLVKVCLALAHIFYRARCAALILPRNGEGGSAAGRDGWGGDLAGVPTRRFAPPSPSRGGISPTTCLFRVGHRMCAGAKQRCVAKATIDLAFQSKINAASNFKCKQTCESLLSVGTHLLPGQMCSVNPSPKRGRWLGRRPRRMGWSFGGSPRPALRATPPVPRRDFPNDLPLQGRP